MKTIISCLTTFLLLLIVISGCTKESGPLKNVSVSCLVFGKVEFSKEGLATCYKLREEAIFPDSIIDFNKGLVFSEIPLSSQKHAIAYPLLKEVPTFLINNPEKTFGCPNCFDQGFIYVEIVYQGKRMKWQIDPTQFPQEIANFISDLNTIMESL